MLRYNILNTKALWFSRWTRKAYAIFVSINKIIHISNLNSVVSELFLPSSNNTCLIAFSSWQAEMLAIKSLSSTYSAITCLADKNLNFIYKPLVISSIEIEAIPFSKKIRTTFFKPVFLN